MIRPIILSLGLAAALATLTLVITSNTSAQELNDPIHNHTIAIQSTTDQSDCWDIAFKQSGVIIVDATLQVAELTRVIVLEALTLTKNSINHAFNLVIDSL